MPCQDGGDVVNDGSEDDGEEYNDIYIRDPKYSKGWLADGWSVESGFIEIKTINDNVIEGYIEAYYDEEFNVKGNFRALKCEL